ncbi:AMP-binding protein [Yoonia sp. SS1-5]|uniref:Long-chain-fatty-acid--CoA ligase n=1 Tax=Yoonia rhodophyticola TaxID=3137370 RepID=A0AAN0M5T9_9RHOB
MNAHTHPSITNASTEVASCASLYELFLRAVQKWPDQTAFSCMGVSFSYRETDNAARAFCGFLQSRGLKPGDRIAVQLPNVLQYPVAMLGALQAGLTIVNLNPLYTKTELVHILRDSKPKALVTLANVAHVAAEALREEPIDTVVVTELADLHPPAKRVLINAVVRHVKKMVPDYQIDSAISFRAAMAIGHRNLAIVHPGAPDDTLLLQYTGGTTGLPKAAILTNANLMANITQTLEHLDGCINEGSECWIAPLPLYHILAFFVHNGLLTALGGQSVLIPNPRDIPGFVKTLKTTRFSGMVCINTLMVALMNDKGFRDLNFDALSLTITGGAAMTQDVADRWRQTTGCTATEGYGLSETSPLVAANLPGQEVIGSIGKPIPGTEISLRDEDDAVAAPGEAGELWVRGPQVMQGYWNKPEITAETLTSDGWLRTGDIATQDENGILRIVDRKKDIVIVSGFNVYPAEVENAAALMPEIAECAAVGIPHEKTGESVCLYVVLQTSNVSAEQIQAHCRTHLTPYKVPSEIRIVPDLPKSNIGKVLRKELRGMSAHVSQGN